MRKLAFAAAVVVPALAWSAARAGDGERSPETGLVVEKLENGLRVIAREARGSGQVALVCYVDGGNRTEPPELSGLSHYYEHLVFRGGTEKQKELETRQVFTQLGTFYGFTTEDATCFYFIVPLAQLDEALWRHVDAVTRVKVTQEKVDKEREVVLSEYKMSVADSPWGSVFHDLLQTAYEKHSYGRTTIGLREVIEKSDLDRFRSFYEARYVPNQMVVSVVGDLPAATLVKKVKDHWKDLKAGRASFELGVPEPPQKAPRKHIEEREGTTQSHMALAFRASGAMDPARVVHDVLAQVLSGGDSARFPTALTARRIALDVGASSPSSKDPGLFTVTIAAEPAKEARALEETVLVLRGLAQGGVSEDELEKAKRRLATETIFGGEALKDEALRYCYWAVAGDESLGTTYLEKVSKVTAEQVRAAARELFRPESTTLAVVRPKGPAPDWDALVRGLSVAGGEAKPVLVEHPSGARLVFEEIRRNKVVALEVKVAGGLLAEPKEQPGLAQLVERCLSRGTKRKDRAAFARAWDSLALSMQTASSEESTTISVRATEETFEDAIALVGEALREPSFSDSEVEKAKEETIEAIAAVEDDSYALTQREYARAIFGADHPYGRPILGTKASVAKLTRADLALFHGRVTKPERMVVSVVGAIDRSRAQALVERHLLGEDAGAGAPRKPERDAAPPLPKRRPGVLLLDRKREQATFDLGLATVAATDPDYLPLQVAARHLGNQLFFRYVYENGMAYRMWTFLRSGTGARPLTLEMGVTPVNFTKARAGVTDSVRALVKSGLTKDELARAKQDLLNRLLLARATNADRARTLASYELVGLGHDWEDRLPEKLELVTPESVARALERHADASAMTLVVVADKKALEAAGADLSPALDEQAGPY